MARRPEAKAKLRSPQPAAIRDARFGFGTMMLCCAALAVLLIAAYGNSLSNGFVWDDHQQIVLNENLRTASPLSRIFTTDTRFDSHSQSLQGVDYRPLQMLTYRIVLGAFGPQAEPFHLVSLLFAIACAIAAFFVARRLLGRWQAAFAVAALFALYPLHTEAIDWIAALPELGCTLFLLIAFALYLQARGTTARRRLVVVLGSLSFFLALLWKETAVIFPLLLVAAEVLLPSESSTDPRQRSLRGILFSVTPSLAALLLYFGIRFAALGGLESGRRDWLLNPLTFALNDLWLLVQYVGKLILPLNLNAYVLLQPIRSITDPRALGGLAFFGVLIAAMVWLIQRAASAQTGITATTSKLLPAIFGLVWTLVTLLPAMNLSALGRNAFTERYLFLPSFGFCIALVVIANALLERVPESPRRYAAPVLLAVTLIGFCVVIVTRNPDWKDDATLFGATLAKSPDAPFVRVMVASAQGNEPSKASDAEVNFRAAIQLANEEVPTDRPDLVTASRGLAWIEANRGDLQQSLALLDSASAIDPANADTDGERGLILLRAGQPALAQPLLERAIAAEPNNENVLSALGLLARDSGHDPARAVSLFERALSAHPGEDDFAAGEHNNLAAAYADLGNWPAAIAQEREAIRIQPTDPEFHVNLAGALAASGHPDEARAEATAALQVSPNDPAAKSLLNEIDQRFGPAK
ncbi:Tetratricopeptide repeat-containing protein [Bryocella elongata]|uniref:Tetratricopeptide repeat-containing protein n=1 Tax=Bryocella elongata TaxID=863522 RepID=A0A1H6A616_9BACT|nr:tetratricopeptide repeat protein [Bryocella elongata]SEG43780.1 Tetratricopeptide repeat-containing protein [Bryocella elongata]